MQRRGKNLRRKLATVSFLLTFLWTIFAPAELKLFPLWELKTCGSDRFACYTFEQTKDILKIDLDLQLKLNDFEGLKTKYTNLEEAYQKLDQANTLLKGNAERLELRLQEKHQVLETTTVELKKAEAHSVWNYLPWIITGVVLLTGAGFGIGFYLGTR